VTLALTIAHPERVPGRSSPGIEPAILGASTASRTFASAGFDGREEGHVGGGRADPPLYSDATNVAGEVWEIAKPKARGSESGACPRRFAGASGIREPHCTHIALTRSRTTTTTFTQW
jgi:hypothetical protein